MFKHLCFIISLIFIISFVLAPVYTLAIPMSDGKEIVSYESDLSGFSDDTVWSHQNNSNGNLTCVVSSADVADEANAKFSIVNYDTVDYPQYSQVISATSSPVSSATSGNGGVRLEDEYFTPIDLDNSIYLYFGMSIRISDVNSNCGMRLVLSKSDGSTTYTDPVYVLDGALYSFSRYICDLSSDYITDFTDPKSGWIDIDVIYNNHYITVYRDGIKLKSATNVMVDISKITEFRPYSFTVSSSGAVNSQMCQSRIVAYTGEPFYYSYTYTNENSVDVVFPICSSDTSFVQIKAEKVDGEFKDISIDNGTLNNHTRAYLDTVTYDGDTRYIYWYMHDLINIKPINK